MADIKGSLTKKVGPLPLYAWGALVVVAVVGYLLWKRSQTSASTAAAGTSTTAASTLPATASTGYVVSGDNGGSGWQGYNNQGSNATTSTSNTVYTAISSGAEALGLANANYPLYANPAPGVYTPYTGGAAGIANAIKLGWAANAQQLYYINPNPTSATTPTATPAVAAAATAPVTAVNTPVTNAGNPATAIAPSALTGTPIPATAQAAPLTGPAALAAAQSGTPLYSATGTPYTGGVAGIQNAIKLGWAKYAEPLYTAA